MGQTSLEWVHYRSDRSQAAGAKCEYHVFLDRPTGEWVAQFWVRFAKPVGEDWETLDRCVTQHEALSLCEAKDREEETSNE